MVPIGYRTIHPSTVTSIRPSTLQSADVEESQSRRLGPREDPIHLSIPANTGGEQRLQLRPTTQIVRRIKPTPIASPRAPLQHVPRQSLTRLLAPSKRLPRPPWPHLDPLYQTPPLPRPPSPQTRLPVASQARWTLAPSVMFSRATSRQPPHHRRAPSGSGSTVRRGGIT